MNLYFLKGKIFYNLKMREGLKIKIKNKKELKLLRKQR